MHHFHQVSIVQNVTYQELKAFFTIASNPVATIALYVAVVFGAFTVFLFVLLVVLYVRHRSMCYIIIHYLKIKNIIKQDFHFLEETKILNKELEEMCCNSKDSMKYRVLRTVSENLLNNPGQAKSLLSSVGTDAEDRQMEKYRETIKILSCRYPDLQCLIKSEVQVMSESKYTLHMNKFLDFNENPLYLSQAPLKDEFPLFLQAIFDERVRPFYLFKFLHFLHYFSLQCNATLYNLLPICCYRSS